MTTTTIERNYRKNPHTARFLAKFHAAGQGLPADLDDNAAEYELAAQESAADLLDEIPVEAPASDRRSAAQAQYMESLINSLMGQDATLGAQAREYTDRMTERGAWTPGREGNASAWITRLLAKLDELRKARPTTPAPAVDVKDGRYAVEEGGTLKFFRVKNGRKPGFVFLDIQASDEWHSIRNLTRIREVLALIAQDAEAALCRYGQELGVCGDCGRTLTDEISRSIGRGPICRSK